MLIGMSQERLGEQLGITFQQIQKYEKGTNRIGASRLQHISTILGVPPAFFFDGLPNAEEESANGFVEAPTTDFVVDFLATSEGLQLNRAFVRIKNGKLRRKVVDLVNEIAATEAAE
ncbi:helix-turn-helix domain-containing protein [Agaricicola taiwanensis]